MYVIYFDIGLRSLAFVKVHIHTIIPPNNLRTLHEHKLTVETIECVDITKFDHKTVNIENCKLDHENNISNQIEHFYQEFKKVFSDVTKVFIERQDPINITQKEQILFNKFKDIAEFIGP